MTETRGVSIAVALISAAGAIIAALIAGVVALIVGSANGSTGQHMPSHVDNGATIEPSLVHILPHSWMTVTGESSARSGEAIFILLR